MHLTAMEGTTNQGHMVAQFPTRFDVRLTGSVNSMPLPDPRPCSGSPPILEKRQILLVASCSVNDRCLSSRDHYVREPPPGFSSRAHVRLAVTLKETFGASVRTDAEVPCVVLISRP